LPRIKLSDRIRDMKKLITILLLSSLATVASAHCCYRQTYHWGGPSVGWVPLAAGVVIGAELASQPRYGTVIVEQPPVYVQQPVVQAPPLGYHWQEMIDPQTNTKKIVLVPNQ